MVSPTIIMDVQTNVVSEILKLTDKHFYQNHDIQIKYNRKTIKHGSVYQMHKVKMMGELIQICPTLSPNLTVRIKNKSVCPIPGESNTKGVCIKQL